MSFRGYVEARCPGGCEPFETEVWSFVRGDVNPELREALLARELNLLLCPACGRPFFAEELCVYFDPAAGLLAFIFPLSYKDNEQFWRRKMGEDFVTLKKGLGKNLPVDSEPELFFGQEELAAALESEDYRGEEREVMEHYARELGLSLYRVSPTYARRHGVPSVLPFLGRKGGAVTRAAVVAGLEKLLASNDRLVSFSAYLNALRDAQDAVLPPGTPDS